jgi:predicted NBD/HSP70 family sugar kinase
VQIRQHNERVILQRLRRLGSASKADLARAAQLTHSAVGQICDDLEARGLIQETGRKSIGQRGQPATLLRLDPAGAYGIGVRLDRARIETVLADLGGAILAHYMHEGPLPPPMQTLEIVRKDIARVVAVLSRDRRGRIAGIGLGRPFNLSSWLYELDLSRDSFATWDDVDFAGELSRVIGLEVLEENDGSAAAIAELFHGLGRQHADFLYLFIGPAIGGGVVLGGDYVRGAGGNAGDVAMMPVAPSVLASAPAARGGRTVLLARASLNTLMRHLRFSCAVGRGIGDLAHAMEQAPAAAGQWLDDCADALVESLLAARALLDVPLVIIDSDLGAAILPNLLARLEPALRSAAPEARTPPDLMAGGFGPLAGALGAATLPLFIHFGLRHAAAIGESGPNDHRGGNRNVAHA